ncbi:MAG: uracil-DNA glycosylase family protein [Acidobacteriota bacterium]
MAKINLRAGLDKSVVANLRSEIRRCDVCAPHLPESPRPVVSFQPEARLLIVGQAPGRRVHESGIPWDDPSGDRLRQWLGVDGSVFYDPTRVAIVPMGFCYPGTGSSGDLPPRPECAERWHRRVLATLPRIELTLLLSRYAQARYLAGRLRKNLTETVRAWRSYGPDLLPLPHPSPRNNRWLKKNPWFEADVIPHLQDRVRGILAA